MGEKISHSTPVAVTSVVQSPVPESDSSTAIKPSGPATPRNFNRILNSSGDFGPTWGNHVGIMGWCCWINFRNFCIYMVLSLMVTHMTTSCCFCWHDSVSVVLRVHYPAEAINTIPFAKPKSQLIEVQKAEMRCLLPKTLLDNGFFPVGTLNSGENNKCNRVCNYSWSGQRKIPSYVNKLVFPEKFMATLRTIAMQEDELFKASSMLEELASPEGERELSVIDVQSAIWEVCSDFGALQVVVDLLHVKLMDLEEHSGIEESDFELLKKALIIDNQEDNKQKANDSEETKLMTRNK